MCRTHPSLNSSLFSFVGNMGNFRHGATSFLNSKLNNVELISENPFLPSNRNCWAESACNLKAQKGTQHFLSVAFVIIRKSAKAIAQ